MFAQCVHLTIVVVHTFLCESKCLLHTVTQFQSGEVQALIMWPQPLAVVTIQYQVKAHVYRKYVLVTTVGAVDSADHLNLRYLCASMFEIAGTIW